MLNNMIYKDREFRRDWKTAVMVKPLTGKTDDMVTRIKAMLGSDERAAEIDAESSGVANTVLLGAEQITALRAMPPQSLTASQRALLARSHEQVLLIENEALRQRALAAESLRDPNKNGGGGRGGG